ncbi:hypothetical protein [Aeromicrobium sp.]|uniref:DNA-3-methyladenine glycosylase family protein n=1 Tax=Aeromicrobium sp. TaxID=1871063 RepID=UPI0030C38358
MPDSTMSGPLELAVRGPFDLAASTRFLEGFAPADRPDAAAEPGVLRLAFPADDGWAPVGAAVRQRDGVTTVELTGALGDHHEAVAAQVARILSLDVDGSGFADVGRRDPVVAELQARYPGLRPVQFHSPYEAACWAIIGQRVRITQAAAVKARLAEQLGGSVIVAGESLTCFPGPQQLRDRAIPGLPTVKVERLRAVADAALEGRLAATRLRSVSTDEALAQLTRSASGRSPPSSSSPAAPVTPICSPPPSAGCMKRWPTPTRSTSPPSTSSPPSPTAGGPTGPGSASSCVPAARTTPPRSPRAVLGGGEGATICVAVWATVLCGLGHRAKVRNTPHGGDIWESHPLIACRRYCHA